MGGPHPISWKGWRANTYFSEKKILPEDWNISSCPRNSNLPSCPCKNKPREVCAKPSLLQPLFSGLPLVSLGMLAAALSCPYIPFNMFAAFSPLPLYMCFLLLSTHFPFPVPPVWSLLFSLPPPLHSKSTGGSHLCLSPYRAFSTKGSVDLFPCLFSFAKWQWPCLIFLCIPST